MHGINDWRLDSLEYDLPKERLEAKIQPSAFTQVLPKTLRRYGQQDTGQVGCGRVWMMLGGSNPNSMLSPAMEPGTEGTTGCGLSAREIALQCGFQPSAVEQKRARGERTGRASSEAAGQKDERGESRQKMWEESGVILRPLVPSSEWEARNRGDQRAQQRAAGVVVGSEIPALWHCMLPCSLYIW